MKLPNQFRTVLRHKSARANAAVSVIGLSVGIACCVLIFLYVRSEFTVNDLFSKSDLIYRLDSEWREPDMGIPMTTLAAAGPTIVREYPEAVEQVRIYLMTNTVRVDGAEIPRGARDDKIPNSASYRVEVMMADSAFKPSRALRGHETFRPSVLWLRRGLVMIQFAAAIVLLISVYAISQQLSFITDKDLGFDREHVLVIQSVPRQFDAEGLSRARTARVHIRDAVPAVRNVSLSWGTAAERGAARAPSCRLDAIATRR